MKGDYPRFKATYTHDELVEHFLLNPSERAVVDTCYGDANRHTVAVLLKTVQHLGDFPDDLQYIPSAVRTFIAHQLQLLWDHTADYPWHSSTRDRRLALIRQHTGFRFATGQDKQALESWLRTQGAAEAPIEEELRECAYTRLRALGIELLAEQELQRVVRSALHGFFQDVYQRVTTQLPETIRATLDRLLEVPPDKSQSSFDMLKAGPSAPGVKNLHAEITKLQTLRSIGMPAAALATVPFKVLRYGRQGIFATNSREQQEISALCLQLLQNSVMLINTILVQQAVEQHPFLEQLRAGDRRAMSPLFYEHVNPYGLFALDLERPPLLEAA